jgi:hypothetical protein
VIAAFSDYDVDQGLLFVFIARCEVLALVDSVRRDFECRGTHQPACGSVFSFFFASVHFFSCSLEEMRATWHPTILIIAFPVV